MRELKFRAWNKEDNCMVDDNDVNFIIMQNGDVCFSGSYPDSCGEWYWHVNDNPTDDLITMQYIGRQDSNDIDIFEGDIIDCDRYTSHDVYRIIIEDIRDLPSQMFGSSLNSLKVVGNIYENPELLELGL